MGVRRVVHKSDQYTDRPLAATLSAPARLGPRHPKRHPATVPGCRMSFRRTCAFLPRRSEREKSTDGRPFTVGGPASSTIPRMDRTFAATADGLLLTARITLAGGDVRSLQREAERGTLHRLRRGAYVDAEAWRVADSRARALLHLRAYAATARVPPIFTHESAAVVHDLPLLSIQPALLHVAASSDSGGRPRDGVRRHRANTIAWEEVDGLHITPVERTVIDLAELLPFRDAVVAADAALRRGFTRRHLDDSAAESNPKGTRRVQRVIDFASPLSESVGESVSRVAIHELGFPAPVLQHPFWDRSGPIGRVDFWWPERQLIGEFDGRIKYLGNLGGPPQEVVWHEKRREDRLRALGPGVARWVWHDLEHPESLAALLSSAGLPRR